jgi:hypothetical protein
VKHTDETKRKLSDMRRGDKNPMRGRKHTPETKAKLAKVLREASGRRRYVAAPISIRIPDLTELGYLVGLLDGEGSFVVRRGVASVVIYNTSTALMGWLSDRIGGHVGGSPDRRGRTPCYAWAVTAQRDVQALCHAVLPLLIVKRDAAERVYAHVTAQLAQQGAFSG